jgi:hypothetical protein
VLFYLYMLGFFDLYTTSQSHFTGDFWAGA